MRMVTPASPPVPASHRVLESVWILPAVVLAIIGTMTAWFSYDEYNRTLEQEYRFLEAHARIADSQLSGLLRNMKQVLRQVAEEWPTLSNKDLAFYEAVLSERKRDIPEMRALAVVDAAGRTVATINPELRGFDASRREYFTAHRDGANQGDFHITKPFKTSFGDYAIACSVPIRDTQGRFLGVVTSGVPYTYFENVLKQVRPEGAASIASVFNRDGDIIYRLPDPERYVGRNVATSELFRNYVTSGQIMTRSIGVAQVDGIKRIFVHRAIGNTTLSLTVARPFDDVFAAWRRNLALRLAILLLAAAVVIYLALMVRHRQRAMLSSRAFTEQVIATANVMVVGLDANGRVAIFNDAAEQLSGYRRAEVLGRDWFELSLPPERRPQAWAMFHGHGESLAAPHSIECPLLTKGGRVRTIAWQNSAIDDRSSPIAAISFGIDITDRTELEEIRRNEALSRQMVSIHEEERRRLATELHDRASPNLSALDINLSVLSDSLPARTAKSLNHLLQDASALLTDTIASIRAISADFRPAVLDYAGFWPAVEGYAQQFSRRTGIAVHTDRNDLDLRLLPEVETNLFRIVQEALTNCGKHARAQAVHIAHSTRGDDVTLSIADDGIGFDPAAPAHPDKPRGAGLATMQKRAEFIGGTFVIETGPGKGTRIIVAFRAAAAA